MNTCVLYAEAEKCVAFSILCVCEGKRERRIANHNFLTRAHKKTMIQSAYVHIGLLCNWN